MRMRDPTLHHNIAEQMRTVKRALDGLNELLVRGHLRRSNQGTPLGASFREEAVLSDDREVRPMGAMRHLAATMPT